MRHLTISTCMLLVIALTAGIASAGYWDVDYTLTGTARTTIFLSGAELCDPDDPGCEFTCDSLDPVTGDANVNYLATSSLAPLVQGRLMAGTTTTEVEQACLGIVISGMPDPTTTLLPGQLGTEGTLTGQTMSLAVVADSSITGALHCTGAACAAAGYTASVPKPLTPTTGPFTFGPWVFTGAGAGDGDFNIATITETIPGPLFSAVQRITYQGQEVSRVWVPEPSMTLLLMPGIAMLGVLERRRKARSS